MSDVEFSACTLCADVESPGFYTGCMIRDKACSNGEGWACNGHGVLARIVTCISDSQKLIDECAPYLKEGETPLQRIERERRDSDGLMTLLAQEKRRVRASAEAMEPALRYIEHVGANYTERGEPHPQQWLVDSLRAALAENPAKLSTTRGEDERADASSARPAATPAATEGPGTNSEICEADGEPCADANLCANVGRCWNAAEAVRRRLYVAENRDQSQEGKSL